MIFVFLASERCNTKLADVWTANSAALSHSVNLYLPLSLVGFQLSISMFILLNPFKLIMRLQYIFFRV